MTPNLMPLSSSLCLSHSYSLHAPKRYISCSLSTPLPEWVLSCTLAALAIEENCLYVRWPCCMHCQSCINLTWLVSHRNDRWLWWTGYWWRKIFHGGIKQPVRLALRIYFPFCCGQCALKLRSLQWNRGWLAYSKHIIILIDSVDNSRQLIVFFISHPESRHLNSYQEKKNEIFFH